MMNTNPLTQIQDNLRRAQQMRAARLVASGAAPEGMVHTVIGANALGDTAIIAPPGQTIGIYELFLWNGNGAQTLILKDGQLVLMQLSNLQSGAGFFLGFAGNNEPHFKVTAGNALNLNLSVGNLVDGFVKYRSL